MKRGDQSRLSLNLSISSHGYAKSVSLSPWRQRQCASRSVLLSDWVPGRYRLVERRSIQILSVKTPVCRYTQIDYQPKKCHARGVTSVRSPTAHVGAYGIVNEIRNRSRTRYYSFTARRTPVLPLTSALWGARSRQDRLDHRVPYSVPVDACSRGLPSHIHFPLRSR